MLAFRDRWPLVENLIASSGRFHLPELRLRASYLVSQPPTGTGIWLRRPRRDYYRSTSVPSGATGPWHARTASVPLSRVRHRCSGRQKLV